MSTQTAASFKKETLAYIRTKKLLIISLVIIGMAILSPLFIAGLGALMDAMSDIYDELGMDISGMTDILSTSVSTGVTSSVSDITGTAIIVLILMLNSAAGGEQKKRSVIIPKSSGLKSFSYIFPKFIIYPVSALVCAIIGMFASWGVSILLFDINDVTFIGVLLAGIISGVCLMLYVCFHLTLGTATGQAGMSAAVCISAAILLSNIFALVNVDYMYNPFALNILAATTIHSGSLTAAGTMNIVITLLFTFGLMILSYLIALFAQNARKIDNTGNEIDL